MRTLFVLVLVSALVALLVVWVGQRQRAELRALDASADSPAAPDGAWPCTGFSRDNEVDRSDATWSYRLCERGSDDRRVEIRFHSVDALDSLEFRVWLTEPVRCDDGAHVRSRIIDIARRGEAVDSLAVPFGTYHGRIWVCARAAQSGAEWTPRAARHGDSP